MSKPNKPADGSKLLTLSCAERYAWKCVFSSEADKPSLYRDAGIGDLEGLGDLDADNDWDFTTWLRGDARPEEFSASREWCAAFTVADTASYNLKDTKW